MNPNADECSASDAPPFSPPAIQIVPFSEPSVAAGIELRVQGQGTEGAFLASHETHYLLAQSAFPLPYPQPPYRLPLPISLSNLYRNGSM